MTLQTAGHKPRAGAGLLAVHGRATSNRNPDYEQRRGSDDVANAGKPSWSGTFG